MTLCSCAKAYGDRGGHLLSQRLAGIVVGEAPTLIVTGGIRIVLAYRFLQVVVVQVKDMRSSFQRCFQYFQSWSATEEDQYVLMATGFILFGGGDLPQIQNFSQSVSDIREI
jgi:hypothetical protein